MSSITFAFTAAMDMKWIPCNANLIFGNKTKSLGAKRDKVQWDVPIQEFHASPKTKTGKALFKIVIDVYVL